MDFYTFKHQYAVHLNEQQEQAVQAVDGPVLLLAVPGSGKTTVLVTRLGYLTLAAGIPPERILTMTYTVSAARDMRQRCAALFGQVAKLLEFRTINGVCSRIIRLYEQTMGRRAFALLEDSRRKTAILAELCQRQTREFAAEGTIRAVETAITYVKNQMLTGEALNTVKVEGIDFPPLFQKYRRILIEQQLMDYDDQMVYALQILLKYPDILHRLQERYRYFCVDEAQDTSKIQHCIIRLLAGRSRNLFMVGDEDQSIYGFRAAYPQALTAFSKIYPDAKVLFLEQNYRSTREIVSAADRFIQKNTQRHPKHMQAVRGSGPAVKQLPVRDRPEQFRRLCALAVDCREETAILYRDNDSALPIIDLLDREGLPYRCRQVESSFFSNRIVRDVQDIIHLAQDPCDGRAFMNIYYKLGAGISRAFALEAADLSMRSGTPVLACLETLAISPWSRQQCKRLEEHFARLLQEDGGNAIFRIDSFMGYGAYLEERSMDRRKLDILRVLGREQPSAPALLDRLDQLCQVVQAGSTDRSAPLILSTIHSSKGLEYRNVILADVIDGILPNAVPEARASKEELEAFEEERRLFYVGMTRAKETLSLFTFTDERLPSVFAEELFPRPKPKPVQKRAVSQYSLAPAGPSEQELAVQAAAFQPGLRLIHRRFGPGTVLARTGDIVSIDFAQSGTKRLSLSTALRNRQLRLTR